MSDVTVMEEDLALGEVRDDSWKVKALVIGSVLGAAVGGLAAYLFVQGADEGERPDIGPGEGIKLGVLVFGLLRSISGIFER